MFVEALDLDEAGLGSWSLGQQRGTDIPREDIGVSASIEAVGFLRIPPGSRRQLNDSLDEIVPDRNARQCCTAAVEDTDQVSLAETPFGGVVRVHTDLFTSVYFPVRRLSYSYCLRS